VTAIAFQRGWKFACLVAVLGCGNGAGDGLSVPHFVPASGDVIDTSRSLVFEMTVADAGGKRTLQQTRSAKQREEILAVDAKAVTSLRTTYLVFDEHTAQDGKEFRPRLPLRGKTYKVEYRDERVRVFRDSKRERATPEEVFHVQMDHADLGKPSRLSELLARQRFARGKPVKLSGADANLFASSPQGITAREAELSLVDVTNGVATIQIRIAIELRQRTLEGQGQLGGEVRVETSTGRLRHVSVTGPLRGSSEGAPWEGKLSLERSWTYP
jgi:hypothetical protein